MEGPGAAAKVRWREEERGKEERKEWTEGKERRRKAWKEGLKEGGKRVRGRQVAHV